MDKNERETTVTLNDGDGITRIWSARRKDITRLRRNDRVQGVRSGLWEGTEWAEFEVPPNQWSPVSGVKRKSKPMSPQQRKAAGDRLRAARSSHKTPRQRQAESDAANRALAARVNSPAAW